MTVRSDTGSGERNLAFASEAIPCIEDVYRFARLLTRDDRAADDVVEETFKQAYRAWHARVPGTDCQQWLFSMCRDVAVRSGRRAQAEAKRQGTEVETTRADIVGSGAVYAAALAGGYQDVFTRIEVAPAISAALDTVPEPFRSTLALVDIEGQSYESAAVILGVSATTVRSLLFRGRRLMQEALIAFARDAGVGPSRPQPELRPHV